MFSALRIMRFWVAIAYLPDTDNYACFLAPPIGRAQGWIAQLLDRREEAVKVEVEMFGGGGFAQGRLHDSGGQYTKTYRERLIAFNRWRSV